MIDFDLLKEELVRDEGYKTHLYKDSVGKYTIGIGHNIDDKGLPHAVIDLLYQIDVDEVITDLDKSFPWWKQLTPNRQRVLINLCFNMGLPVLKTFVNTLKAMANNDTQGVVIGLTNSKWYKQVGNRAIRLVKMWETG